MAHTFYPRVRQQLTSQLWFHLLIALIILIMRGALGGQRLDFFDLIYHGASLDEITAKADKLPPDVTSLATWSAFTSPHRKFDTDLKTEIIVIEVLEGVLWLCGAALWSIKYMNLKSGFGIELPAYWGVAVAWYFSVMVWGVFSGILNIAVGAVLLVESALGLGFAVWRFRQASAGIAPKGRVPAAWDIEGNARSHNSANSQNAEKETEHQS